MTRIIFFGERGFSLSKLILRLLSINVCFYFFFFKSVSFVGEEAGGEEVCFERFGFFITTIL